MSDIFDALPRQPSLQPVLKTRLLENLQGQNGVDPWLSSGVLWQEGATALLRLIVISRPNSRTKSSPAELDNLPIHLLKLSTRFPKAPLRLLIGYGR